MKPKTFFSALLNTFSSSRYYLDILNTKFHFSLRFFLICCVLLSVVHAVAFWFVQLPELQANASKTFDQLQSSYPTNLSIRWDGTTLNATPTAQLLVPYPAGFQDNTPQSQLAIIDTHVPDASPAATVTALNQSSMLFFSAHSLFVFGGSDTWSEVMLKDVPGFEHPFIISSATLPSFIQQWKSMLQDCLKTISFLYPVVFTPVLMIGTFIRVLLESVLVYLVIQFSRRKIPYMKVVQLGLHVAIVAETVQFISTLLFPAIGLPMFTLAFWGYFTLILFQLRDVQMVPPKKK